MGQFGPHHREFGHMSKNLDTVDEVSFTSRLQAWFAIAPAGVDCPVFHAWSSHGEPLRRGPLLPYLRSQRCSRSQKDNFGNRKFFVWQSPWVSSSIRWSFQALSCSQTSSQNSTEDRSSCQDRMSVGLANFIPHQGSVTIGQAARQGNGGPEAARTSQISVA